MFIGLKPSSERQSMDEVLEGLRRKTRDIAGLNVPSGVVFVAIRVQDDNVVAGLADCTSTNLVPTPFE